MMHTHAVWLNETQERSKTASAQKEEKEGGEDDGS